MNILLGYGHITPPNETPEWFREMWGQLGDQVKLFSPNGGDVTYQFGMDFQKILDSLPGFSPDYVILYRVEYWPIPQGLETCPCPVIGLIGDWNLNVARVLSAQHAIDHNFTDRQGVAFLNRWGLKAGHFPMFYHDPNVHYKMQNVAKKYDVVFIGNLDSSIQEERNRWLYRLAKLSRHYNVKIRANLYGDDYRTLLNESKIVFNRSIRSELNMRCFEAPACGALLFIEEENLEVRDFFQDQVDCVFYNESNLETLLQYYLTHDEEREKLAEAGCKKAQSLHYSTRMQQLLEQIHALPRHERMRKPVFEVPDPTYFSWNFFPGFSLPEKAADALTSDECNNTAANRIAWSLQTKQSSALDASVESLLQRSLQDSPDDPVVHFNLGGYYEATHQYDNAMRCYQKTLERLHKNKALDSRMLPILIPFSEFAIRWWQPYVRAPKTHSQKQGEILFQETCYKLATLYWSAQKTQEALRFAQQGSQNQEPHASLLELLGKLHEAEEHYREAHESYSAATSLKPLKLPLWVDQLRVITKLDRTQAEKFLDEHLEILSAFPQASAMKNELLGAFFEKDRCR